jgi:hypothetical protein
MKPRDFVHLPRLADLGEFGKSEFRDAIADIRNVLIEEGWSGRATSSLTRIEHPADAHEASSDARGERDPGDPFAARWSASDHARQHEDRDHPHELDFDR